MLNYVAFHLGLHFLPKYLSRGIRYVTRLPTEDETILHMYRYNSLLLRSCECVSLVEGLHRFSISHNVYCVSTYIVVLVLMFPNGGHHP